MGMEWRCEQITEDTPHLYVRRGWMMVHEMQPRRLRNALGLDWTGNNYSENALKCYAGMPTIYFKSFSLNLSVRLSARPSVHPDQANYSLLQIAFTGACRCDRCLLTHTRGTRADMTGPGGEC